MCLVTQLGYQSYEAFEHPNERETHHLAFTLLPFASCCGSSWTRSEATEGSLQTTMPPGNIGIVGDRWNDILYLSLFTGGFRPRELGSVAQVLNLPPTFLDDKHTNSLPNAARLSSSISQSNPFHSISLFLAPLGSSSPMTLRVLFALQFLHVFRSNSVAPSLTVHRINNITKTISNEWQFPTRVLSQKKLAACRTLRPIPSTFTTRHTTRARTQSFGQPAPSRPLSASPFSFAEPNNSQGR